MINGETQIIAHIGYPTHSFKAPMIYNPYFEASGINTIVVPMSCKTAPYPGLLHSLFSLDNLRGALITMPHKMVTAGLVDEISPTARVAGACNAVRRAADGRLVGDHFDGEGFVRGIKRKGLSLKGASALVVGCGGVGSAIAASLAAAGVHKLTLDDVQPSVVEALAGRIKTQHPSISLVLHSRDPQGCDLVVNATPLGMNEGDPLPIDMNRLSPQTFVGEVVMRREMTAFLIAAQARGCPIQVGVDMLFEQIPAYLEFFEYPSTTAEHLRSLARLSY
jgi:shikimate dehydrogenase